MTGTYQALALLLSYPEESHRPLYAAALDVIDGDNLLGSTTSLRRLAAELVQDDLLELQARYVEWFDRSRTLSLHLYEHVHGESRERGRAMVELKRLYAAHGLELSAHELPDYLPAFLEFLSVLEPAEAAVLLGEAAHVLAAMHERLRKRQSPYAAVLEALVALADTRADPQLLDLLLREPETDPNDLAALDRAWAEQPVAFGPEQHSSCAGSAPASGQGRASA